MKKMFTMMVAAVLAVSMLAGCGGKTTGSVPPMAPLLWRR